MSAASKKLLAAVLFLLGTLVAILVYVRSVPDPFVPSESHTRSDLALRELGARFTALEASERHVAETVWAKELLAQQCGRTFESLWDSLNAATNKLALVAGFESGEIVLPDWGPPQALPHGIEVRVPTGRGPVLSTQAWRRLVQEAERMGWQLVQTEFRHNRFQADEEGAPLRSCYYFSGHLVRLSPLERAALTGDLVVEWGIRPPGEPWAPVKRIDASGLSIQTRRGEPPFRLVLDEVVTPPAKSYPIDPLIVYDLDGDGMSEILLPAENLVYRRRGADRYGAELLCRDPPHLILAGTLGDFDGDGGPDLLCARPEGLHLFNGTVQGSFDQASRLVWSPEEPLVNPMVLSCGDVDRDGDLDVFLGQYKVPSLGQILRPHYYNANDGHPAYLLLNAGRGTFTDATVASGLERKRWRRVFSASLVDLDDDCDQDLLVVSDFAGLDLYHNDGRGHFTDVTSEWVSEPNAFGMALTLADFNVDGRLDFLMNGMNSPTVDRLEHLGLRRPGTTEDHTMRTRMSFGNRLFLARPEGGFEQTSMGRGVARSGWSWGCSAFDCDNDGFPDLYITNGHESKESVSDYEPEFWLHDIYVGDSVDDLTATAYFMGKYGRTRGQGWSYGGYEKNRLYLNQAGGSFVEVGHLLGVALEADSRCVVSDDLDGDGRVDLLVTTAEVWPEVRQTLRVYRNLLEDGGHWIGFRVQGGAPSPVGARTTLHYAGRSTVRPIVTGDSFRSQHASTVHFGLGAVDRVERVEIRWPQGRKVTLDEPALDRYHTIRAPIPKGAGP